MKISYHKEIKITDYDSAPQMTNNILEFMDENIFRFDPHFEISIQSKILQCLVKGMNEDKTYSETLKWIKKRLNSIWDDELKYKFDVHYIRYARPNIEL